jgi:hypothetical protein
VVVAAEAAGLRDAIVMARLRFDGVYVITPTHNQIGPFDFGGAYDPASDRQDTLAELMHHGYEDAYRQFIEPVVGASGEQLVQLPLQSPDGTDDGKREADLKMGLYLRDLEP